MASKVFLKRIQNSALFTGSIKQMSTGTSEPQFLGIQSKFTDVLKFTNAESYDPIPVYKILQPLGQSEYKNPKLDKDTLRKMYANMVTIGIMDKILYESQRQGRISFYMTNSGEEAVQTGSAAALTLKDIVYAQYREAGVLLYRGFKLSEFINQCYGNYKDKGKGKQMPVHYGSKELNFITISSPLTTQMPQAVGAAYAIKRSKKDACVICYFGDGAASEGDAHAALNFAATLDCPIIFFCRNNGYAISTPTSEQYKGDGIAARGPAYGINTLRVDGNDVLAVYQATEFARDFCIEEKKPVLIEAMTYRIGHHSTSDDSTAYRSADEIAQWNACTPTSKFRHYLENLGFWSEAEERNLINIKKEETLSAFSDGEKQPKPHWEELFTDVYHDMPPHIRNQMESLRSHLNEYSEHYPLDLFKKA